MTAASIEILIDGKSQNLSKINTPSISKLNSKNKRKRVKLIEDQDQITLKVLMEQDQAQDLNSEISLEFD